MPQVDLSGLKDIIVPIRPDFWPLAVGWWIVIIGAVVLVLACIGWFVHYYFSPLVYAQRELKKLKKHYHSSVILAREISKLLKRAAILRFSAEKVAVLSDETWARFLSAEAHSKIKPDVIKFIAYSAYLPDNQKNTLSVSELYRAGQILLTNVLKDKHHDHHNN